MKSFPRCALACILLVAFPLAAVEVQISESGSALICPRSFAAWLAYGDNDTNFTTWVGENRNGGRASDNRFYPRTRGASTVAGIILWYFDLTAHSGKLATANAEVSCNVMWGWTQSETYRLYPILSNWHESSVTWSNWIGVGFTASGDKTYTNWFGPELDADTVIGTMKSTWTISQSVVQAWLNNPSAFKGLAVIPDGDSIRYFWTRQATWIPVADRPLMVLHMQSLNNPPATPTNISPANTAIAQPLTPTLTASPFSDPNGHGHAESQWQIALDPSFLTPVVNIHTATELTSYTVGTGLLKPHTRYYWRVRYKDNAAEPEWSAWSAPTWFDTVLDLSQPVIIPAVRSAWIRAVQPTSNFNPSTTASFELNAADSSGPTSMILHFFDLSVFSRYPELIINGPGQFSYTVHYVWPNNPPTVRLYELTAPWDEPTVTWSNYLGEAAWTSRVNRVMDEKILEHFSWGQTETWGNVHQQVLQDWLHSPTNNCGLALLTEDTAGVSAMFRSMPLPWLRMEIINTNVPRPDRPINISPLNGAAGVSLTPQLQASAYSGTGTHTASRWQIAEDAQMLALIWDSGATNALTTITVPAGRLQYTGRYYWRVAYINHLGGQSAWSMPTFFDTVVQAGLVSRKAGRTALISFAEPERNYNGINDNLLKFVGRSNNVAATMLCWFDLAVLEGQSLNGPAQLQLHWDYVSTEFGAQTFACYPLLRAWDETNVTWNSFNGPGNENYAQHFGAQLDVQEAVGYESNFFTIPQAVVEQWLSTSTSNCGLAIYPDVSIPNAFVYSRKSPLKAPTLIIDVIPEPAELALALASLALWRRQARLSGGKALLQPGTG
ncbi:MAG: DNRLRE domain-containing protein [bacterium]|nr:DNRLRE domain-containing protein [bacterium]